MLWPIVASFGMVIALVVILLGLSALLGEHHLERATGRPYESGVASTGSARLRFGASFYLVAVFFVIFDLEAAFIFSFQRHPQSDRERFGSVVAEEPVAASASSMAIATCSFSCPRVEVWKEHLPCPTKIFFRSST